MKVTTITCVFLAVYTTHATIKLGDQQIAGKNGELTFLGPSFTSLHRPQPPLKKLSPSPTHTVLLDTSTLKNIKFGNSPNPYPSRFQDQWDSDHVRMPCSKDNKFSFDPYKGMERWSVIHQALNQKWSNFEDLKKSIFTYNPGYAGNWNFDGLKEYIENMDVKTRHELFSVTLVKMAKLALQLPELITQPIPLLKSGMWHKITMTQKQAACLLANAFFCTFPRRNNHTSNSEFGNYPGINFDTLFRSEKITQVKLDFIFHYFRQSTENMSPGVLTFGRISMKNFPDWSLSKKPLSKLVVSRKGTIEDSGEGMHQVDFADKFLGGGVLRRGSVQEEIRFLISPELMVSMLIAEELKDNEAFVMTGIERYSSYKGYARALQWDGPYKDYTGSDEWGRRKVQVVAIDAVKYSQWSDQFSKYYINRELNKAYAGFSGSSGINPPNLNPVATGNWGSGYFGGDKQLKSLIQIMAASQAGRDIIYYTFGDDMFMHELYEIYQILIQRGNQIGYIYKILEQYSTRIPSNISLFDYIKE